MKAKRLNRDELDAQVKELVASNRPITAIKLVRDNMDNMSLKEAYDYVQKIGAS